MNKDNSITCQFNKCDPFNFVCDPNTTSNKITCKRCDTETLCTEMHLRFHAVFVIYVWQSQNWIGLKTAGKILQYQNPYRNVEQCFSCKHTNRWTDEVILTSMLTNKITCVNLGRISVTFTILVSWFYCYMGQFYSQSSLTGGATTKIRCSALTDSAQPMSLAFKSGNNSHVPFSKKIYCILFSMWRWHLLYITSKSL